MKGIFRLLSLNLLMVILLIGTISNIEGNANIGLQPDDIIIYAMPFDFDEYSAFTAASYATAQWNSAVYAALVKRSAANSRDYVADLAVSMPSVSTDGKTFTFKLQDDLKFSNGNNLTTSDLEFSFKAALTPAVNTNFYGSYLGFMTNDSITVIDSLSLSLTLNVPFTFPYSLLGFPVIDEEVFGDRFDRCVGGVAEDCLWNDPTGADVVSAGPFMVSDIDNVNEIVTVVLNPFYYGADHVETDKIIFKKIADKDEAISALAGGSIDILDAQYGAGLKELSSLNDVSEDFFVDPSHEEISLNHLNGYFGTGLLTPNGAAVAADAQVSALNVRKAMSHVVNRRLAVEILEDLAIQASTAMPAGSIGWDPTLVPREFSVETAKIMMEAAGFNYSTLSPLETGSSFSDSFFNITVLSSNTNPALNQWASNYVLELPKIGIGVNDHVSTSWDEIVQRTFGYADGLPPDYVNGGFDILFSGFDWDLDWNPQGFYDASGRCDTGDCSNFYNFDLKETMTNIASLIDSYVSELDFDARYVKAKTVQAELYKWIPVLPILYPKSHWGFASDLSGIDSLLIGVNAQEWDLVAHRGFSTHPRQSFNARTNASTNDANYFVLSIGIATFVIRRKQK